MVGGGLAAGALAWAVPSVISVPAAAAATIAPGLVIDPFTIPAAASGAFDQQVTVIDPVDGISVTRTIQTTAAGVSLAIANGIATFESTGPGFAQINYEFASPVDLTGFTDVESPCTFVGPLTSLFLFVSFPGGSQQAFRLADQPVARFDLTVVVPDNLANVTSLLFVVGSSSGSLDLTLGPITPT